MWAAGLFSFVAPKRCSHFPSIQTSDVWIFLWVAKPQPQPQPDLCSGSNRQGFKASQPSSLETLTEKAIELPQSLGGRWCSVFGSGATGHSLKKGFHMTVTWLQEEIWGAPGSGRWPHEPVHLVSGHGFLRLWALQNPAPAFQ